MSPPLVIVGSAIVLNIGILLFGVVWLRRQMKRIAAERAARKRGASREEASDRP